MNSRYIIAAALAASLGAAQAKSISQKAEADQVINMGSNEPAMAKAFAQAKKTLPARVAGDPAACLTVRDNLACPAFAMVDGQFTINAEQCDGCMFCVQLSPDLKPGKKEAK